MRQTDRHAEREREEDIDRREYGSTALLTVKM